MKYCVRFIRSHAVFIIATVLAAITCFIVPPDEGYKSYVDFKTLSCLLATLCVVCALKNIKFFTILARKIIHSTPNLRICVLALIYITFIGSLFIANDMALITFLPLGWYVLHDTGNEKYTPWLFVLQNIAANLGGMLTPFGNPQNLYLYSYFNIPTREFCAIMLPPFLLAIAMLVIACLPIKAEKLTIGEKFPEKLNASRTALYVAMFVFSLLIVFRVVPYWIGLILIPSVLFFVDREALKMVDYPLLGTFFFFFIFAGNLARVDVVNEVISSLLNKDTLLVSILSCQGISNVPSAILLSRFTTDYRALLLGVNIGGTGTLIASLASLITFSEFRILYPGQGKRYFWLFTLINAIFLVVMTLAAKLFLL